MSELDLIQIAKQIRVVLRRSEYPAGRRVDRLYL